MDLIIRRARPGDAEGLARLYLQFWEPHGAVDPLIRLKGKNDFRTHLAFARKDIADKRCIILVAIEDDRPIGYLEAVVKRNERLFRLSRYGWFNSAVTDRRHRRRGVARALAAAMLRLLRSMGIRYVKMTAYNSNLTALRTWKRLGFKPLSTNLMLDLGRDHSGRPGRNKR